jgi:lysophospholipase L1-like esterase
VKELFVMQAVKKSFLHVAVALCVTLYLAFLCSIPTPAVHTAADPIKIMPLGDSITYGTNSSNGGGYRTPLWNDLVSQGANVDFVGSQQSGPENSDLDNEGHPGWRIDQISANIVTWLAIYQPQIILLHIGTNDILQNYDVADAPIRLSRLIHQITTTLPSATLLVAQIIPINTSSNSQVQTYNSAIPGIVQMAGSNVHMVDMYDAVSPTLLPDNIHPSDAGYGLMANVWYAALLPFLLLSAQNSSFSTNFENEIFHSRPQPIKEIQAPRRILLGVSVMVEALAICREGKGHDHHV